MSENSKVFTVEIKGEEKELRLTKPNIVQQQEAQKIWNVVFIEEYKKKDAVTRDDIKKLMRSKGEWNDKKESEEQTLNKKIADNRYRLYEGGFGKKAGRDLAVETRKLFLELVTLNQQYNKYDGISCESIADDARFNALFASSLVYNDSGEKVFPSYQAYVDHESAPWINVAFREFISLMSGIDDSFGDDFEENKFLKEYGFANDEGHLIDEQGRLIDVDGHLVDEDGRRINEDGQVVDINGRPIDKDGNYLVDRKPFTDD